MEWRVEGLDQEQISWLLVGPFLPFHSSSLTPPHWCGHLAATLLWLQQHLYSHHWVVRRNPGSLACAQGYWAFGGLVQKTKVSRGPGKIIKITCTEFIEAILFSLGGLHGFHLGPGG